MTGLRLDPDRLFPGDPTTRTIARRLHAEIRDLPIVSPHGHTDPAWFALNEPFPDPAALLITPDHYVFRMLYSQGVAMEALGVPRADGGPVETDPRAIWRLFAAHYPLFRGTPSRLWHDWVYSEVFGLTERLSEATADLYFDTIADKLQQEAFRPRALFERFGIEVIATTESPTDDLRHHAALRQSGWSGRVITAFRPDPVLDPEYEGFRDNVAKLGDMTGRDAFSYAGYLEALFERRAFFKTMGATSTDHGHPTAFTADLPRAEARRCSARR
jgi:glucuronate isomerase